MDTSTERQQMRQLLADLAARATETLPAESAGRITKAVKLVLAGDVEMQADGTALVGSSTAPEKVYSVNGSCPCADFARAPATWCQHRIARALVIRLGRSLAAPPAPAPEAPAAPLPEAPAS